MQSFLRKLKFQYLEQNAKDKYVKTIVSDDAPLITAASNEEIRQRNEEKKRNLKEIKVKLAEKQEDVRTLAPLVEEGTKADSMEGPLSASVTNMHPSQITRKRAP